MPLLVDRGVTKFTQHWMLHTCTPSLFMASLQSLLQLVVHLSACGGANDHHRGANGHHRGANGHRGGAQAQLRCACVRLRCAHVRLRCAGMCQIDEESTPPKWRLCSSSQPTRSQGSSSLKCILCHITQTSDVAATTSSLNQDLPLAATEVRRRSPSRCSSFQCISGKQSQLANVIRTLQFWTLDCATDPVAQ